MSDGSEVKTGGKRRAPASLFALGYREMPGEVEAEGVIGGGKYRFVKLFKHDFFAATALYERMEARVGGAASPDGHGSANCADPWHPTGTGELAVLKVQRVYPLWGFPMRWLGKWVAGREIRIYEKLQGVAGVPQFLGRVGPTGFLHAFIPGEELRAGLPLTTEFFVELEKLFSDIHGRHVAYADSNKRENILYGEDGRPWLIDFQISFELKKGVRGHFLARWIYRKMVRADWYHFYKHKTRLLPESCGAEDFEKAQKRGVLHSLHRLIARPFIQVRRKFLSRYDLANTR
jgi:hypothetical protein